MGWKVFPLHSVVNGRCTCGKPHPDGKGIAKHPRTKRGFKEATTDPEQIRRWFEKWPASNIEIATGDGLVVVNVNGPEGARELKALVEANEPLPATLVAQTGNGFHIVLAERLGAPALRSAARNNVHVRAAGGYIVACPSKHANGRNYQWINKLPVAVLPDWLRQWLSGYEITAKPASSLALGPLPAYLQDKTSKDISSSAAESLKQVWTPSEQARLISALASIPANSYETWFQVGMALKDLGWEGNGTDLGFTIWDEWSQTCPAKYNVAACKSKWNSFRRSGVSIGTIYHLAKQHGWNPVEAAAAQPGLNGHANGVNGHHALPAAFGGQQPIFWPDVNEKKRPRITCTNANVAVRALQIECEKDLFHEKLTTGGHMIEQWAGDMSDDVIQMIRKTIRARFGFDPGEKNVRDACIQLCLENQFDPILDYLAGLTWDGQPRLDHWMVRYMGAPDTDLNRTIGRLVLIAAVRRQHRPGTKFDQIVVLESKEGYGKFNGDRDPRG